MYGICVSIPQPCASSRQNSMAHTLFTDSISVDFKTVLCTEFKLAATSQLVFTEIRSSVPSFPELALSHLTAEPQP